MWKWLWAQFLSKVFGDGFGADVAARGAVYLGDNIRKSIDRDEVPVTALRLKPGDTYTVVARPPATNAERKLAASQEKLVDRKRKLDAPSRAQLKAARRLSKAQKQVDHRRAGRRRYRKAAEREVRWGKRFDRVMTPSKQQVRTDAELDAVSVDLDALRAERLESARRERKRPRRRKPRSRFYFD